MCEVAAAEALENPLRRGASQPSKAAIAHSGERRNIRRHAMRLIGYVPSETNATAFSDFLCVEGINNQVEADKEGWAIWIHSEDEWQKAKDLLGAFLANPRDPRFAGKSARAREIREKTVAEAEDAEKRTFDRKAVFRATTGYSVGALTAVLVFLCAALTVLAWMGHKERIYNELLMTKVMVVEGGAKWVKGLPEIRSGEFWRLIMPAFIHTQFLHLLFNLLLLLDLGSMVESRLGTGRLGLMVILFAIASNLAQYFAEGPFFHGFSGVNYGLFGYIWARGRLDPKSGLYLHPHSVAMLVVWFFLCLVNLIPNVANMAHAAGLGLGLLWGFAASTPALRRGGGE